jgi:DNA-directed RNA polymerase specialized sigma24 family protein
MARYVAGSRRAAAAVPFGRHTGGREISEFVLEARAGDRFAFELLYRRTVRGIATYLAPWYPDEQDRSRRLRDIYRGAWVELPALTAPAAFTVWLLRLTHAEVRRASEDERRIARATSPAVRGLYELPDRLREVTALRCYLGLSAEEIADALGEHVDLVVHWERRALEELALGR